MAEEISFAENLTSQEGQADLARLLTDYTVNNLPEEKQRLQRELDRTGEEVRTLESNYADGRGQAIASIPPGLYHRWNIQHPGCWQDKGFVDEFLYDNRQCLLPGYRPKPKAVIFDMGGKPRLSIGAAIYWQNKARINAHS